MHLCIFVVVSEANPRTMILKERYEAFVSYFSTHMPAAETELEYRNPYELLVAVILSAQCTDKRVNMVMPGFLEVFPDPYTLAAAKPETIFPLIKSISYPNNKSKNLSGMARLLTEKFGGVVPSETEQLIELPGVGRKTANVIASVVYEKPAMAVDTHVFRVANRIGLTRNSRTPLATEKQLVKHLPESVIHMAHHWLILHGRYVCVARKPKCHECGITHFCKYFASQVKRQKW